MWSDRRKGAGQNPLGRKKVTLRDGQGIRTGIGFCGALGVVMVLFILPVRYVPGEGDIRNLEPSSTSPLIVLNTLPDSTPVKTVETVSTETFIWRESHPPPSPSPPPPPPPPPPPFDPPMLPPNAVAPRMLHKPDINYPIDLKKQEIEGRVLLLVVLDDNGAVTDARIQETSGFRAFDSAAVYGICKTRFSPAYLNNRPIAVKIRLPVIFLLSPE